MADAPDLGSGSERIGGSSPLARTTLVVSFEDRDIARTISAQIQWVPEKPNVEFPKVIRSRRIGATLYGKTEKYTYYRVVYHVAGQGVIRSLKLLARLLILGDRSAPGA